MSKFAFVVLVLITLVCNSLFCVMSNDMSHATLGRPLKKSSWAIWIIIPTLIQIILIDRLFHPVVYLILMVFISVMICLTVPNTTETPFSRLGSWLVFAIPIEAALIFSSATLADKAPGSFWAINFGGTVKGNVMALLFPFIAIAIVGLIEAIAVPKDKPKDKPAKPAKEETTTTTMATDDLEEISSDEAAMAS